MTAFDPTPLRPDAPALPALGNEIFKGLTARQHAAIALGVPDSGTPWLDAMINRRRRDEFAGIAAMNPIGPHGFTFATRAAWIYQQADAMLAASDKEIGNG